MRNLILALVTLVYTSGAAFAQELEFDAKSIKKLALENGDGNADITASEAPKAKVVVTKKTFEKGCKLTTELQGDTLVVKVESESMFKNPNCEVDFAISVPKTSELSLNIGSGSVTSKGISGDTSFQVGSGSVAIAGELDELEGKVGSGSVEIEGVVKEAELKVGSGNIRLNYAKLPDSGELEVTTGSGNVDVSVPAGSKLKSSVVSGSGTVSIDAEQSPDAKFELSGKTGSGNVTVKKRM